ncbi:MAG TPA: ABC transporter permease [Bryobacteraceae bacterium]|nr:ABC transporter permease [Bryobacteraceae bacterium]
MLTLRHAFRSLIKSPGYAVTAILTLALGVGASTAIFTTVDAVLIHPLGYHDPDQLVLITKNMPKFELFKSDHSALDFLDYRNFSRSFSHMAALQTNSVNLTGAGEPVRVYGLRVSTSLFPMLGVQPVAGRLFRPEEEQPGQDRVAILGEGLWRSRFGADPHIAGSTVEIDGQKYAVVGVVQPVLQFMEQAQLYVPLAFTPAQLDPNARGHQNMDVVARLKPGVSLEQGRAEMKIVAARMTRNLPVWYPPDWNIQLDPLAGQVAGDLRTPLLVLLGAVGMVLLIGCVNVANLLLARATARQKEIGLRIALGASRGRIVRQLLGESLLLSALAGAAGLAMAAWVLAAFQRFGSPELLRWQTIRINAPALSFAAALALLTCLIFGLAPALSASQVRPAHRGRSSGRLRSLLVTAEVALAVMLLASAGLLLRSYARLWQTNPGFHPDHLLTARISLPPLQYRDPAQITAFQSDLLAEVKALPGVVSAGAVDGLPFGAGGGGGDFQIAGRPWPASEAVPDVEKRVATTDYFRTMGIPLKQGHFFTAQDGAGRHRVCLIDETLARSFFPKGDAIGQFLIDARVSQTRGDTSEIIGIVGGVKDRNLMNGPRPVIYHPALQTPRPFMNLVVRTAGDPLALVPAIQQRVRALDRNLPVYKIATMEQNLSDSLMRRRFSMLLLAVLAAFALCLAGLGIYGVISYAVSQRVREIGIRMALGAEAGNVERLILSQGMRPVAAGVALGLLASLAAMRALASLLYGVQPSDPATFLAVSGILLAIATLASVIPARRAAHVDPMAALRHE